MSEPKKAVEIPANIIVRSPNFIGDQVMAIPFYEALRRHYASARLTLLAGEPAAEVKVDGLFDDRIVLQRKDRSFPRGCFRTGRGLLAKHFDLAISLPASFSSAFLFFTARIPCRVGFAEAGAEALLTSWLRWPGREAGRHKAVLYLDLLELLTGRSALLPPPPRLEKRAREDLVVLAPGASLPLREWPYAMELLSRLGAAFASMRFIVVGSAGEEKWKSAIKRLNDPKVEDWIGRTTLDELVDLLGRARLVIANDSGVAHLAATVAGAPTLVLFGPGDPAYVVPRGEAVTIARVGDLPCSPCEKPYCRAPYGYQRCLRALSVETVLEQACRILTSGERPGFNTRT